MSRDDNIVWSTQSMVFSLSLQHDETSAKHISDVDKYKEKKY